MTRHRWRWSWLVVAATLWAALVRLYRLDRLPPQAWVDEAWYNLRARDLVLTGDFHVFYPTFWGGMHPVMVDLAAVIHGLGLHSLVASRLVAALAGIVTIPLAYAAMKELWRGTNWPPVRQRLTAALTAVILSSLFYLVLASRIGYAPALIPPVMLLYVWQIRRAQRRGAWLSWIAAGLALGTAQYINLNGRFLILLAVMLGVHDLAVSPPARRRSTLLGLSLAAGTAALVALPLIGFFLREPQWLLARTGHITTGLKGDTFNFLSHNALRIAASLTFIGDLNPRHNLPGRPMLDWLQSIGFGVGVVWALRNFRRVRTGRELLAWLGLMKLSSLVTDEAPQFERMIAVGIPAAALVAIGWVELWPWFERVGKWWWPRRPSACACALAVVCVGASTAIGTYDFFVRYPRTPGLAAAMTTYPVELARDLIARAQTETVFVERITEAEDVYAFDFMLPGTGVRRLDFRHCLPLTDGRASRTTYLIFSGRDPAAADRLVRGYSRPTIHSLEPDAATLMDKAVLVEIAAGTAAPAFQHPARVRFAPGLTLLGYDTSGTTVRAGERVFLTLHWRVEAEPGALDLIAFAHVGGLGASSTLIVRSESSACDGRYAPALWRPGDVIPSRFSLAIPPATLPGEYPVVIGWYQRPSHQRLVLLNADRPLPDHRALLATITVLAPPGPATRAGSGQ